MAILNWMSKETNDFLIVSIKHWTMVTKVTGGEQVLKRGDRKSSSCW